MFCVTSSSAFKVVVTIAEELGTLNSIERSSANGRGSMVYIIDMNDGRIVTWNDHEHRRWDQSRGKLYRIITSSVVGASHELNTHTGRGERYRKHDDKDAEGGMR